MNFEDILYTEENHVATITINRPEVYNAFRGRTCVELIRAFQQASWNTDIGVIVFTGAGEKAFCTGGDQKSHDGQYDGQYDGRGTIGMPVEDLQTVIRDAPKPVIARVDGFAIGGGNVLAVLCDLTIASDRSKFGQVGPKMGSVDAGFGTAYLARVVGEKKAREIWFLCKRYSADEALEMGLINAVVPADQLDATVAEWCAQINTHSPTAMALAKRSFNADTESIRGLSSLSMQALKLYYDTDESREGVTALNEKRPADFKKYAK